MGVNNLIQIGNSDDRLTQPRWADLIGDMRDLLNVGWRDRLQIHGEWFSAPDQPWQNANWCVEILPPAWWARASEPDGPEGAWARAQAVIARDAEMDENRNRLKERVRDLCLHYSQDTFAWTTGTVELVETGWIPDRNRQEPIPGAAKDSTRPTSASTGDGEPGGSAGITMKPSQAARRRTPALTGDGETWARTEDELRGDDEAPPVPGWDIVDPHDHTEPESCPVVDCIRNDPFGKAAG